MGENCHESRGIEVTDLGEGDVRLADLPGRQDALTVGFGHEGQTGGPAQGLRLTRESQEQRAPQGPGSIGEGAMPTVQGIELADADGVTHPATGCGPRDAPRANPAGPTGDPGWSNPWP